MYEIQRCRLWYRYLQPLLLLYYLYLQAPLLFYLQPPLLPHPTLVVDNQKQFSVLFAEVAELNLLI